MDNCSFNRPYDDQSLLRNYLEAEAKIYIQKEILNNNFELAWSYILDYEIFFNPFSDRKSQILKWKDIAVVDVDESKNVLETANLITIKNIKAKDSLHLACALEAKCNFFITTDDKILNKHVEEIIIIDPVGFIRIAEGER